MCSFRRNLLFGVASALLLATALKATYPGENGKIVFVSDRSGSWQLYTIDSDGRNIAQITNMPATDFDAWLPVFSPDGHQIVFCYGGGDSAEIASTEIYVINVDGGGLKQLTNDGSFDCAATWSPDGASIIYAKTYIPTNQTLVTVMRADGSGKQTTLTTGDFRFWGTFAPIYTPNGREVLFQSSFGGLVSAAWIMNSDGTHPKRLSPAPLEAAAFDISPNGKDVLLLNHVNTDLSNSLYVMDLSTRKIRRLTHLDNVHDQPGGYSPDGKKIVFISDRLNTVNTFDLFTMDADGSNIERIATAVGACADRNCVDATWGPKPSN